jgi:hypothetical protein
MTIEQTVEISADHRLVIEVPPEIPAGRAVLAFTPAPEIPTAAKPEDGERPTPISDWLLGIASQPGI